MSEAVTEPLRFTSARKFASFNATPEAALVCAMSLALTSDSDNLFPEALALAEALTPRLRRFVPLLDV